MADQNMVSYPLVYWLADRQSGELLISEPLIDPLPCPNLLSRSVQADVSQPRFVLHESLSQHSQCSNAVNWNEPTEQRIDFECGEDRLQLIETTRSLCPHGGGEMIYGLICLAQTPGLSRSLFRQSKLASLNSFTRRVLDGNDLGTMLEAGMDMVEQVLPVRRVGIWRVQPDSSEVRLIAERDYTGHGLSNRHILSMEDVNATFPGVVFGSPQVVDDLRVDENPTDWPVDYEAADIRSIVSVPMHSDGRFFGAVTLWLAEPGPHAAEAIELLHQVAGHLTAAILRVELVKEVDEQKADLQRRVTHRSDMLNDQYQRQSALLKIEDAVRTASNMDVVLSRIVEVIKESMQATFGASIFLWDPKARQFTLTATSAQRTPQRKSGAQVRRTGGVTQWVVEHGEPVVVPTVSADLKNQNPHLTEIGVEAYIAVPIHAENEVLGVLYVLEKSPRDFSQADIDYSMVLANRAGLGISRQRLLDQLRSRNRELRRTVNLMAGREVRMRELKSVIKDLRERLTTYGETDLPDDPMAVWMDREV